MMTHAAVPVTSVSRMAHPMRKIVTTATTATTVIATTVIAMGASSGSHVAPAAALTKRPSMRTHAVVHATAVSRMALPTTRMVNMLIANNDVHMIVL